MRILVISLYQVQEQFLCAHHRQEEPKSSGAGCVGWWLQNLIFPLHLVFRSIYSAWFLLYNPMLSPCSSMCVCVCVCVCLRVCVCACVHSTITKPEPCQSPHQPCPTSAAPTLVAVCHTPTRAQEDLHTLQLHTAEVFQGEV